MSMHLMQHNTSVNRYSKKACISKMGIRTRNRTTSKHHRQAKSDWEKDREHDPNVHKLPRALSREDAQEHEQEAELTKARAEEVAELVEVYNLVPI
jgi:hypothetical protein